MTMDGILSGFSKVPSIRVPVFNPTGGSVSEGIVPGGGAYFSKKRIWEGAPTSKYLGFDINDQTTWEGIVIDPDGDYLGDTNNGITFWKPAPQGSSNPNAYKSVQINEDGMTIQGGNFFYVPYGFDQGQESTWNGILINDTGIYGYEVSPDYSANKRWELINDGIRIYGGNSMWGPESYDINDETTWNGVLLDQTGIFCYEVVSSAAKLRASLSNDGIRIYGGNSMWLPEDWDTEDNTTWNGVAINNEGINCYKVNVETSTAKLKASMSADGMVLYGSGFAWVPEDYNPSNRSGVLINSDGIYGYHNNAQTVGIYNADGGCMFGSTYAKSIGFDPVSSVFHIGRDVVVVVDAEGGGYDQLGTISSIYGGYNFAKVTGTTANSEGGTVSVAHGLTSTKIVSVTVQVWYASGECVGPGFVTTAEYQFDWYFDGTNLVVKNHSTNSGSILSKAFTAIIIYED